MPNYQNGKIYAIRSFQTEKKYIGSTTQLLCQRLREHKNCKKTTSQQILQYDDYYIELIENYACNSKEELQKREGELIRENKELCVNIVIPQRTNKEYVADNKEHINIKRIENQNIDRDAFLQNRKEIRETEENKEKNRIYLDKTKETRKLYRESEEVKAREKIRLQLNKDKYNENRRLKYINKR